MNYQNNRYNRSCIHHSMGFMGAPRCPYCGAPNMKGVWAARLTNIVLLIFIVLSFLALFKMLSER